MTLDLKQAADYLHLHPQTVQERAKRGMIPGAAKPGKRWVFLEEGLRAYLISLSPCSTGLEKRGTSTLARPVDGLDAVLGLRTGGKRRHSTTA
jgi:hypothetical protein